MAANETWGMASKKVTVNMALGQMLLAPNLLRE